MRSLKEILKDNPFKDDLLTTWETNALEFSGLQWIGNGQNMCQRFKYFVLDDDREWIDGNHGRYTCYEHPFYIHSELLPNPFIGRPTAPIWILTINPSWCHVDIFDLINSTEGARKYSGSPLCDDPKQRMAEFIKGKENEVAERVGAQIKQLALEETDFFVFHQAFDTCSVKGNVSYGAYGWWKKCLIGSKTDLFPLSRLPDNTEPMARILGDKVFVMEFNPYRSRRFDQNKLWDRYEKSGYGRFWQGMVRYAFEQRKVIIIRAEKKRHKGNLIVKAIRNLQLDVDSPFVSLLNSSRSFTLSKGNIANSKVFRRISDIVNGQH